MNKTEIKKVQTEVLGVCTGSTFSNPDHWAVPARIVEMDVEIVNRNSKWGTVSSRTRDGVRVQLLDPTTLEPKHDIQRRYLRDDDGNEILDADGACKFETIDNGEVPPTVVKTRQVVGPWDEIVDRRAAVKKRTAEASSANAKAENDVKEWAARLGIKEYSLPTLSAGHGFDPYVLRSNRRTLLDMLEKAYELGYADALEGK